jgi:hypothetical protein
MNNDLGARVREALLSAWVFVRAEAIRSARWWRAAGRRVESNARTAWSRWRESRRRVADARQSELEAAIVASADDDVASITGRIDIASDLEVVLIVPRGARALRDPAPWPHLAAHARRRGVDLLVVSPRRDVRAHATDNGLRAGSSIGRVRRAPQHRFSIGGRSFTVPRMNLGRWVRGALLAVGIAAIGIVGCYAVPSAEIVIVPVSNPVSTTVSARLDPLADEPDIQRMVVPVIRQRIEIVTTVSTTTSGTTEIGEDFATVEVEFTNETATDRTIEAGLQLISDENILFATEEDLDVPAGASAAVAATAVLPGEPGNVAAGTLTARDPLPRGVTVTNPSAASGGTNVEVPAVASEDVDRVREISDDVLLRVGQREMAEAIPEGSTYFPETLTSAVFSENPLQNPGDPATAFLMEYTAIISALVLDVDTAVLFGSRVLQSSLGPDEALLPGSTEVTVAAETDRVAGQLVVEMTIQGRIAPVIDPTALEGSLTGTTKSEASALISDAIALEAPPEIRLLPDFIPWRWLPRRSDRISIILEGPASLLELDDPDDGSDVDEETATSRDLAESGAGG